MWNLKGIKMENITVEKKGQIGIVTVNRPKELNSMNSETRKELATAFEELELDKEVNISILTGSPGKAFIAGADIKEFSKMEIKDRKVMKEDWRITEVIANSTKPVIAMINGFCLGGGLEIAMACDLRTASKNSKLGQPEINIGIIPGAGGTQRLTKLVGEGRSMELILTGNMISAEKAEKWGLVNLVTDEELLEKMTMEIAKQIAEKSPFAVERAKKSVKLASNTSMKKGLKKEQELFVECFKSNDGKEGIKAFIEKRKPEFKGN
ncbi:MAG: crotonase [Marine Group III euryarchaeote CG-Epi3]|uniref:Crotonase n=1 Tax=Marine Group III euryarchaeote CG-Epi3 TaxID=1888997 RepID=A0A1J5TR47_9ARCH|nr:MAG: crotonase [Marine Group III euryarchaeote CG-Epi3]